MSYLEQILHLIGFPLCVPSMMRLLTMSARGLPRLPDSVSGRFLSGDMKSSGCLSGVSEKGEESLSLSASIILSGATFLTGVSGL